MVAGSSPTSDVLKVNIIIRIGVWVSLLIFYFMSTLYFLSIVTVCKISHHKHPNFLPISMPNLKLITVQMVTPEIRTEMTTAIKICSGCENHDGTMLYHFTKNGDKL